MPKFTLVTKHVRFTTFHHLEAESMEELREKWEKDLADFNAGPTAKWAHNAAGAEVQEHVALVSIKDEESPADSAEQPQGIEDNEEIYDQQISGLMTQIISICKEHRIPIFAHFEYAEKEYCTTRIPFDGESGVFERLFELATGDSLSRRSPLYLTTRNKDGDVTHMEVIL